MAKYLKVAFPQKCIGCELCVMEAQRQLNKVGLEGSLIRIFRNKKKGTDFLEYSIETDPRISMLDIEKIAASCPTDVFEIIDKEPNELVE